MEEQDVEALEGGGVDAAEVGGDHSAGLGAEELRPRGPGPVRRGIDPGVAEDLPHARRCDFVAESGQFAVDAPVAPGGVLAGHAQGEPADLGVHGWPSPSRGGGLGPPARDEAAMPPNDGGRLHDEEHVAEARPVDDSGEHGEDGAVGLGEPRSGDLSLQDEDLVAQGEDLGVALVAGGEQPTEAAQHQTGDRGDEVHGGGDGIGVSPPVRSAVFVSQAGRRRRREALGSWSVAVRRHLVEGRGSARGAPFRPVRAVATEVPGAA